MGKFGRRQALGMGAAAVVGSAFHAKKSLAASLPLSAAVTLGGQTYEFREDTGYDLGDFVSDIGGFTQRCVRSQASGSPLTVYFRPDRNSDRAEVVFELGQALNAAPANLGAYTVTIARGGQILATVNVPAHYWFSRWRWQSAPRPVVVGDIAKLIEQNLLPPYDRRSASTSTDERPPVAAAVSGSISGDTTSAGVLAVGGAVSDTLSDAGARHYYRLDAQAGQNYRFTIGDGTLPEPLLVIRDANDQYVTQNYAAGGVANVLTFRPTASGVYWLVVMGLNGGKGTYAVASAGVLTAGSAITGSLQAGGIDRVAVALTANQIYRFNIGAGTLAKPLVVIRDANDSYLSQNFLFGAIMNSLPFRAPATGNYWVTVSGLEGGAGSYSVTLASDSILAPASVTPSPTAAPSQGSTVYTAMSLAGIEPYMPNTGERPDIGLLTEPQAEFVCTDSAAALAVVRAQAEGAGTVPWHIRDDDTGSPFDFRRYPRASWYADHEDPSAGAPNIKTATTPITIDSAHQPALAYLPYLLTGDAYHLEDLQFQATWNWGTLPAAYRPSIPQARAFAWSLRTLAQCARITPRTVPAWLLPQDYWYQQLSTVRQFFESEYVNSPRPERNRFRATANIDSARGEAAAPEGTWVDPWQDEFVAAVMGWVISMGFTEWRTAFEWKIGSTIARTGVTSGWARAQATPYRMILRETATSPIADGWAQAWELTRRIAGLQVDGDNWTPSDMTYLSYTRGALVYADLLASGNVADNLAWANNQLKKRGWKTAYKWRFGPGL